MKRSLVILWLIGIFLLCLPMSWLILIKQHPSAPMKDLYLLMGVCSVFAFAITGGLSWLVYRFMKKREMANAARNTLLIFTGLVVGVACVSAPEAAKAIERRNKYAQEEQDHVDFIRGCMESGKTGMIPMLKGEVKDPEKSMDNYCNCVYDSMYADYEVNEMMYDASISNEEFDRHPRVREIKNKCQQEMMKEVYSQPVDSL